MFGLQTLILLSRSQLTHHGVDQALGAYWVVLVQAVSFQHFQEHPIHHCGIPQQLLMR